MRMVDIIHKKKLGQALAKAEIDFAVQGYTKGSVPDYQMSALLMAIYFQGMNKDEIANLTKAFIESGDRVDLSAIAGTKVDKHSTGGVGDKLSLIIIPLVAAAGVPVAKMSGRGLGHTGGTIDKLESIPGFRTDLTADEFIEHVNTHKMAIVGQTANLTPADKKIYSLRDVTATVNSIPLIASSVMSKKIASGADAIVLDVKVGSGAFMKSIEDAKELAATMVAIGKSLKRKTVAVVTNMDQPLGYEVGNANEVREAIEVLRGQGAKDETTIALTIAAHMTVLGGAFADFDAAYQDLEKMLASGKAIEKLKELVKIQGGNPDVIDHPDLLPQAEKHIEVKARQRGFITAIDAEEIGITAMLVGAGRQTKEDQIDFAAGVTMNKKVGDCISVGDTICVLHTNLSDTQEAEERALRAFTLGNEVPKQSGLIYEVVSDI